MFSRFFYKWCERTVTYFFSDNPCDKPIMAQTFILLDIFASVSRVDFFEKKKKDFLPLSSMELNQT